MGVLPLLGRLLHHHPRRRRAKTPKGWGCFVIEPGMKGTWEVVETVRKYLRIRLNFQLVS